MATFLSTPMPRRARIEPAGIRSKGDGRGVVLVNGFPAGPMVDLDEAMAIAKWINDGGYSAIVADYTSHQPAGS